MRSAGAKSMKLRRKHGSPPNLRWRALRAPPSPGVPDWLTGWRRRVLEHLCALAGYPRRHQGRHRPDELLIDVHRAADFAHRFSTESPARCISSCAGITSAPCKTLKIYPGFKSIAEDTVRSVVGWRAAV